MIYNILIAAILIVAFFMCVKAYTLGLQHGKQLANKEVPKININPVKTLKEHIEATEEKKKAKDEHEGWHGENGIMNYDPYKEVKK